MEVYTSYYSYLFSSLALAFTLTYRTYVFLVKLLSFETYRANVYVLFTDYTPPSFNVTYGTYGWFATLLLLFFLVFIYLISVGPKDLWKSICRSSCSNLFSSSAQIFLLWAAGPMYFLAFVVKLVSFETYMANVYTEVLLLHFLQVMLHLFLNVTYRTYG